MQVNPTLVSSVLLVPKAAISNPDKYQGQRQVFWLTPLFRGLPVRPESYRKWDSGNTGSEKALSGAYSIG